MMGLVLAPSRFDGLSDLVVSSTGEGVTSSSHDVDDDGPVTERPDWERSL
jgi:hypothetical protein